MARSKIQHILGKKALLYILLCSSFVTLITTSLQLYTDYQYDLDEIEERLINIRSGHLNALAVNLWNFNDAAIAQQLQGIVSLPAIQAATLTSTQGDVYQAGLRGVQVHVDEQEYEIRYKDQSIGHLSLIVTFDEVINKVYSKVGLILATQFLKTFIIASCILAIMYWLVTRHIYRVVEYTNGISIDTLDENLGLEGNRKRPDELDQLVEAINNMRVQLLQDITKRRQAEEALRVLNEQLEDMVKLRTEDLEDTLQELTITQDNLIQSEKMSALGQLVAGVSHEINTPIGICVTANSNMKGLLDDLNNKFVENKLTKTAFRNFIEDQQQNLDITQRSLHRAAELVKNFKSVSVHQSSDNLLECDMHALLMEITGTVETMFKQQEYQIDFDVDRGLLIETYPGAWTQILTNLLMNSHLHGFEDQQGGNVKIVCFKDRDKLHFYYEDDGVGIPEGIIHQVFEPFITTKRGSGGSGLGLNILYNLVRSKLNGTVSVENLPRGCKFKITCPL